MGFSVMFPSITAFQILIHFIGVNIMALMIMIRYDFNVIVPLTFFCCVIPVIMELYVVYSTLDKSKIITYIRERRELRLLSLKKEVLRRDEAERRLEDEDDN